MTHFTNLRATLSKSIGNLTSLPADMPVSAIPFDSLHIDHVALPPAHLPPLFNSHERCLGDPARLFAGTSFETEDGDDVAGAKSQWLDVMEDLKPYGLRGRIAGINSYLNRSTDTQTLAGLGRHLAWTGPLGVFHNAGSEHTAFAKYLSLRKIGVNADRLRLVWIKDKFAQSNRVVLAATFAGRNYILDDRCPTIVADDTLTHFRPYCSTSPTRFSLHWNGQKKEGWEASLKQLGSHALH